MSGLRENSREDEVEIANDILKDVLWKKPESIRCICWKRKPENRISNGSACTPGELFSLDGLIRSIV
jgi:hypothetical protein